MINLIDINALKFDENGLIPAIAQDFDTKEVLMLAFMNEESLKKTLSGGQMCYYSRSRKELWVKGETSGHYQTVIESWYDCDEDALLFLVKQEGAACHTGERSCFYRGLTESQVSLKGREQTAHPRPGALSSLYAVIRDRRLNPKEGSYTNYLFDKGLDKILKKVGEETAEIIIAAKNPEKAELVYETADLMYHLSVLLAHSEVTWGDIFAELDKRGSK